MLITLIISKILVLLYVLSIINVIRHLTIIIRRIFTQGEPYVLSPNSLLLLGISIAYIITGIITGIMICP